MRTQSPILLLLLLTILHTTLSEDTPVNINTEEAITQLNQNNFDNLVDSANSGDWLVMFHTGCPDCQKAYPAWQDLAKGKTGVKLGMVNSTESPDLATKYNIEKHPSFVYFKQGTIENYVGDNTVEGWKNFINKKKGITKPEEIPPEQLNDAVEASVEHLTSANFDSVVGQENSDPWFIMFYAPWCPHCQRATPAWQELGKQNKKGVRIGMVNCVDQPELAAKNEIQGFPTFIYFDKDNKEIFNGERSVESWSQFIDQKQGANKQAQAEAPALPVPESQEPANKEAELQDLSEQKKDLNAVGDTPALASTTNKEDAVEYLAADNFDSLVNGQDSKPWFVMFHTPQSPESQQVAPAWMEFARGRKEDDVHVGMLNGADYPDLANKYGVQGYPTFVYFNNGASEIYNGERKIKPWSQFVDGKRQPNDETAITVEPAAEEQRQDFVNGTLNTTTADQRDASLQGESESADKPAILNFADRASNESTQLTETNIADAQRQQPSQPGAEPLINENEGNAPNQAERESEAQPAATELFERPTNEAVQREQESQDERRNATRSPRLSRSGRFIDRPDERRQRPEEESPEHATASLRNGTRSDESDEQSQDERNQFFNRSSFRAGEIAALEARRRPHRPNESSRNRTNPNQRNAPRPNDQHSSTPASTEFLGRQANETGENAAAQGEQLPQNTELFDRPVNETADIAGIQREHLSQRPNGPSANDSILNRGNGLIPGEQHSSTPASTEFLGRQANETDEAAAAQREQPSQNLHGSSAGILTNDRNASLQGGERPNFPVNADFPERPANVTAEMEAAQRGELPQNLGERSSNASRDERREQQPSSTELFLDGELVDQQSEDSRARPEQLEQARSRSEQPEGARTRLEQPGDSRARPEQLEQARNRPEQPEEAQNRPEQLEQAQNRPEQPEETQKRPEQLEQAQNRPEQPEGARTRPEQPEDSQARPEQLEQLEQLEQAQNRPEQLEQARNRPEQPEDPRARPEQLEQVRNRPEQLEQAQNRPEQPEEAQHRPEQLEQLRNRPEQPEESRARLEPGNFEERNKKIIPGETRPSEEPEARQPEPLDRKQPEPTDQALDARGELVKAGEKLPTAIAYERPSAGATEQRPPFSVEDDGQYDDSRPFYQDPFLVVGIVAASLLCVFFGVLCMQQFRGKYAKVDTIDRDIELGSVDENSNSAREEYSHSIRV